MKAQLPSRSMEDARVVLTLGAGGVGKTTLSIATAVHLARLGKRVGLISIDPAKRLATALGISLDGQLRSLSMHEITSAGGSLDAAMLDQKAVFDELVRRFAKDKKSQEAIFANKLYQAASARFSGALEYMALAKLESMLTSGKYDVVVVDTPPDAHAVDFLNRPNVLAGFFDSKVMAWIVKPLYFAKRWGMDRIIARGEKMIGGIAEVTGIKALQILAEFLVLMQEIIHALNQSGERLKRIFLSADAHILLVTTLKAAPLRTATVIRKRLEEWDMHVDTIALNRLVPAAVLKEAKEIIRHTDPQLSKLAAYASRLDQYAYPPLELGLLSPEFASNGIQVLRLEEVDYDLQNEAGIIKLSGSLKSNVL